MQKKEFPFIEVAGTPYEVGYAIGRATVQQLYALLHAISLDYEHHTQQKFSRFVQQAQDYLPLNKEFFPKYIDEIKGIAEGACLPFDCVFSLSCLEELPWETILRKAQQDKCTTIVAQTIEGLVLGHNEDYAHYTPNLLYIIKAQQQNAPTFTSLAYVGTLPGSSLGLNTADIAFSGNSLDANDCRTGILKNFLYRAILDAESIEHAILTIKTAKRAIGGNYVLASQKQAVNIETSAQELSVTPVIQFPFFHTNHYITADMKPYQKTCSQSSLDRYKTLQERAHTIHTRQDIKTILSDHTAPICRHVPNKDSSSITLASTLIDISHHKLLVKKDNPCSTTHEYIAY